MSSQLADSQDARPADSQDAGPADAQDARLAEWEAEINRSMNEILSKAMEETRWSEGGIWNCFVSDNQPMLPDNTVATSSTQPVKVKGSKLQDTDYRALIRNGQLTYDEVNHLLGPGQTAGPGTLPHLHRFLADEEERIRRLHRGKIQELVEDTEIGSAIVGAVASVSTWFQSVL
ncbi:hypothetical protein BKA70DRAFT_1415789 [Coprinopsis sp. MPI-PUGE-AT-0042]|nr:hypothetical protein BKA70DRAFT_1240503 [Coprinopsis sp. MPI-PUGE-AT-0042]KAH6884026.1 hypothetical protein BKA70DRAFT_1446356 [Coprinopsis sp. MPI-PUGE-AT-0042]KAH6905508.1 hypothetical protein BKA70DRAFT_1431146 [Coprinopsis sp. MPI-PUGE-AT-0042]KAH6917741.1 hypothetical protein BKA70DRAFT_1415789 [Coprinopsis sp. MPI-PUGE-AT-0042]